MSSSMRRAGAIVAGVATLLLGTTTAEAARTDARAAQQGTDA